jgi:hypothetical protein
MVPAPGQAFPQVPQFQTSCDLSVQKPAQQSGWTLPEHTLLQPPQLLSSVCQFTHTLLQQRWVLALQTVPQPPQSFMSEVVSWHRSSLQSVRPGMQRGWQVRLLQMPEVQLMPASHDPQ